MHIINKSKINQGLLDVFNFVVTRLLVEKKLEGYQILKMLHGQLKRIPL